MALFASCTPFGTIEKAEFTFVNGTAASSIDVVPAAGQDWTAFTLAAPGDTHVVESENGSLLFTVTVDGVPAPTKNYDYDPDTRTFTFEDP